MNLSRNNLLLAICGLVVTAGAVYYFFFFSNDTGPAVSGDALVASDAELSFITLVSRIDPIVFDTRLLSDPRFINRQDLRTTVLPENSGRTDPFAPFSGAATR